VVQARARHGHWRQSRESPVVVVVALTGAWSAAAMAAPASEAAVVVVGLPDEEALDARLQTSDQKSGESVQVTGVHSGSPAVRHEWSASVTYRLGYLQLFVSRLLVLRFAFKLSQFNP
jgi:hypothetical protein